MIAMMFGIWYLAIAIGMKLAGVFGEASEGIAETQGLSYFFWILTAKLYGKKEQIVQDPFSNSKKEILT